MKLKTLVKIVIALLIVGALALLLPKFFGSSQADNFFRTQRVNKGQLRIAVGATGTINPVMVVNVGTQISGTIKEILVDFNDSVKEGDLLMVLDDQLFQAKADMSKANLANSQAQLRLAQLKYDRQEKLYKANSAPKEEFDTAQANLEMAKATVAQHEASLAQDMYNLNNTRIVAPVDGVIINRAVDVGQTVAASFQTPTLIDIAGDLTKMQINASFSEADIGRLTPGLEVTFTVDAYLGESFTGKLRQIRLNPTITSNVVTYDVIIDVDNPTLKLLPGMTAYVDIELYKQNDVLLVPAAALNYRPTGAEALDPIAPQTAGVTPPDGSGSVPPPDGPLPGQAPGQAPSDGPDGPPSAAGQALAAEGSHEPTAYWGSGEGAPEAAAKKDPYETEDTHGRVYVLGADGKPKMVALTLGTSDLRQTIVKGGDLKEGDLVIIGENQPQEDRTLLSGSAGPGPGRRF
ncbi:MAG: efflux RND transporter periplasmic adaptor subunit [Deltaproteobacteria bacterium]|jgi:HlyD family secretion protein|nr:efflux RND transporter periplasmic adaptor subunit [Deltaproteobacteria bacterium]